MNLSLRSCTALLCLSVLGASPAFAQTWDPVSSDGMNNTAMGTGALMNPNLDADGGCHNTASGADTLSVDTSGSYNSATGFGSLTSNLSGDNNTGLGAETLYTNTSGSDNTATGYQALYSNDSGNNNAAFGVLALAENRNGFRNTAIGGGSLNKNSGSYNTALGFSAGSALSTGTDNIDIANVAVAGESHTLRLGTQGTAGTPGSGIVKTFIAGIADTQLTGSAVYVNSEGQLGVLASAERFKTNIEPMGAATERLAELRPVTFSLKNDPSGTLQYGLIAEEVAKVYPELVIRGEDGRVSGIRYEELAPMLLNQVQQQHEQLAAQASQLAAQGAQLAQLQALVAAMMNPAKDERVAAR
jgi:hypothetical protein